MCHGNTQPVLLVPVIIDILGCESKLQTVDLLSCGFGLKIIVCVKASSSRASGDIYGTVMFCCCSFFLLDQMRVIIDLNRLD